MRTTFMYCSLLILICFISPAVDSSFASETAEKPVVTDADRIVIDMPDLIPEGISYDPATDRFLLSSFRHRGILAVERDCSWTWLADPGKAEDLLASAGLLVDGSRGLVWTCTGNVPHLKGNATLRQNQTGLVAIDLSTGAEKQTFMMPKKDLFHLFNDLTQASDGTLFISGFSADVIYRVHPEDDTVTVWAELEKGSFPNGIALRPDGRLLYVATQYGITIIDIASRQQRTLHAPESLRAIDGLYAWNNSLVAIQHLRPFNEEGTRVIQAFLSSDGTKVTRIIELQRNEPDYDQPTTGVIVGDSFYYIANSQFSAYDEAFNLNVDVLKPVVILRAPLLRTFPGPPQ